MIKTAVRLCVNSHGSKTAKIPNKVILPTIKSSKCQRDAESFFSIFQDDGRLPPWICLGHIWTTHSEYLRVSITLQNLVMIDAVVFII